MAKSSVSAPQVNRHLKRLQPYPPGKPIEEVQRAYGLDSVIKLASNENPLGPSPRALKAMTEVASEMHLYPDGAGYYLKEALAEWLGVKTDCLILGNGSDEILSLLGHAYLSRKRGIVTSEFSFVRYRMVAEEAGSPCTLVPMTGMSHDADALAAAVGPETAMVCLDVPGNPTGTLMPKRDLLRLLRAIPKETIVLLDQAYFEYACDDPRFADGLKLRREFPNVVVTRTFSKAFGLAGLRIGFMVARPEIINDLERVRPPFNANRMAQSAALAALGDKAFLRRSVQVNVKGKKKLEDGLTKLGCCFWHSATNFLLVDLGRPAGPVFQALLEKGVVVRPMPPSMNDGRVLRISIGTPAENTRCLKALREVLKS